MNILRQAVLCVGLALAGCATLQPAPSTIANATVLDEKAAIAVELTYQAAALSATTARRAGIIGDARWADVQAIDRRAYAAVLAVRAAYRTGNSTTYNAAFAEARNTLAALLESAR